MKIAALSPQFVIEEPPGEKKVAAEKTASELQLRVVRPQAANADAGPGALDEEVQEGLKRLSKLIHAKDASKDAGKERRRERDPRELVLAKLESQQRERRRVTELYARVEKSAEPSDQQGKNIDKSC